MTPLASIHADLRSAMNGIAARSIRESGMAYRLVYGIELPRLREIASAYAPDRHLAQELWQEDVRECKMLAIMLYPIGDFDRDMATLWVEAIQPSQVELAQLLAMDRLTHLPDAADLAFQWIAEERPMFQLCGFLVITRLLMQGGRLSPDAEAEFIDQAEAAQHATWTPLRRAVQNALVRLDREEPPYQEASTS